MILDTTVSKGLKCSVDEWALNAYLGYPVSVYSNHSDRLESGHKLTNVRTLTGPSLFGAEFVGFVICVVLFIVEVGPGPLTLVRAPFLKV